MNQKKFQKTAANATETMHQSLLTQPFAKPHFFAYEVVTSVSVVPFTVVSSKTLKFNFPPIGWNAFMGDHQRRRRPHCQRCFQPKDTVHFGAQAKTKDSIKRPNFEWIMEMNGDKRRVFCGASHTISNKLIKIFCECDDERLISLWVS